MGMKESKIVISGLLLGVTFLFSQCRVGNVYTAPDPGLPGHYRADDSLHSDSAVALERSAIFRDSVVLKLIDKALEHNLDLLQLDQDIAIAGETVKRARAAFFPSVNLTAAEFIQENHSKSWYSNPSSRYYGDNAPPSTMYINKVQHMTSVQAAWEPDLWGKFALQREEAGARFQEAMMWKQLLQTQVVAAVATAYYNLLMLDAQLEVAHANYALTDSTLKIVHLQFRAGQVTSLAIQQTEAQKLSAYSLIPRLQQAIAVQENELKQLLGEYPGKITRHGLLDDVPLSFSFVAGVPAELLANRPDIKASEWNLVAANARVGIRQAMRYPSLTLRITGGLDAMTAINWLNVPGSAYAILTGSLLQPLFQNRQLKTNYKIAVHERERAALGYQNEVIKAVGEVSNHLTNLENLQQEYRIAEDRIRVAKMAVRNASLLFKSGMANYLEVITAQRNALESELDLVEVKMQIIAANISLYRALGGG